MSLLKAEQRYRGLCNNLRDGMASVDMHGRITDFNEAFRAMLGYERNDIYALTFKDITPEKWHPVEEKILSDQVMQNGYSQIYEKEYIRKDGTIFPVELRTYLLKDDAGLPTGIWAFVHDITLKKEAEKAFIESEKELKKRVKELEDFYDMAVGRELRMIQLKKENAELTKKLEKYKKSYSDRI